MLVEHRSVPVRRVHLLPVARGQHREVDGSELFADSCGGSHDRGSVGDVDGHDKHGPTRHLPKSVFAAGRDRDGSAAAEEFACHGGADSAGPADDPGGLPSQIHAEPLVSWSWLTPRYPLRKPASL